MKNIKMNRKHWLLCIILIESQLLAQTSNDNPQPKETVGNTAQGQQKASAPAITYENISYGDHSNHVIDFWKADVDGPAPLVVFIHGGGFTGGSHDKVTGKKIQQYLNAGIHHASIEYRFIQQGFSKGHSSYRKPMKRLNFQCPTRNAQYPLLKTCSPPTPIPNHDRAVPLTLDKPGSGHTFNLAPPHRSSV